MKRYQFQTPRQPGEGLRIGAVRHLPMYVPRSEYAKRNYFDVWMPVLSPSPGWLTRRKKHHDWDHEFWHSFFSAYERAMRQHTDARQTIEMLAKLARRTPISLGCHCEEGVWCHVNVLMQLIEEARAHPEEGLGRDVTICKPGRGRLFPCCVYTARDPDTLSVLAGKPGSHELDSGRRWVDAQAFVERAVHARQRVPILFGDATGRSSHLRYWGLLDGVEVGDEGTTYWVSEVREFRRQHNPHELVGEHSGRKLSSKYIRSYALCRTPGFLKVG